MKKIISIFLAFIFFFLLILFFNVRSDKQVDFSAQVKPILNKHCISCHGGVKKTAGFSVLFESEAKGITHSGKPSIIPGNAKESEFIKRLHYTDPEMRMPYHKSSLTKNEISILTDWVNQEQIGEPTGLIFQLLNLSYLKFLQFLRKKILNLTLSIILLQQEWRK